MGSVALRTQRQLLVLTTIKSYTTLVPVLRPVYLVVAIRRECCAVCSAFLRR